MFVKKFEADTLDEALKAVKAELGPDAIILKTVTNKGLKGAFKKKRIEITAAISERSFDKKSKVEEVLNEDQKRDFHRRGAAEMKGAIEGYAAAKATKPAPATSEAGAYGSMGLNRVVNQISRGTEGLGEAARKTSQALKSSLDDFLGEEGAGTEDDALDQEFLSRPVPQPRARPRAQTEQVDRLELSERPAPRAAAPPPRQVVEAPVQEERPNISIAAKELINELRQEVRTQQHRLEIMEKKIFELTQNAPAAEALRQGAQGLYQLRTTLKALDVDEAVVVDLVRKATYGLSKEELENADIVFEFALKEMTNAIHTSMPLFSTLDGNEPVITVLISEAAAGQTSMSMKIAVLKKDVELVQYSTEGTSSGGADFAAQVFGLKVHRAQQPSEIVQCCRKALEAGKSVMVDLRLASKQLDDTKKFVESLRRSFPHVEVLVTLSAIHSELYNRKILSRYKDLADGLIISHVDLCLNFGALFNVHRAHNKVPLKFFGTGPVVPDDIESATAERVMAGLFQF
jgi:flagellar biosynthesis protein FlhF